MDITLIQFIGILLIVIMLSTIIMSSFDKQTFYNFTLPILGKDCDLNLSTLVKGFKKNPEQSSEEPNSEEQSSEEQSSEEQSSEEQSSEEPDKPLVGMYKSKQMYLEQFPKMRTLSNERQHNKLPDEPTMRKILEDLSNSGILY